jgi:hypothetical protein
MVNQGSVDFIFDKPSIESSAHEGPFPGRLELNRAYEIPVATVKVSRGIFAPVLQKIAQLLVHLLKDFLFSQADAIGGIRENGRVVEIVERLKILHLKRNSISVGQFV